MARIRFKCPSINRAVVSSELAEENYQKSLLPERDDLISADEVLGCHGDVERSETLALEVFRKCMQVFHSDDNPAMDVDVSYSTWIAEKLMLQLLPEPLVSFASGGGEVLIRPGEACAWFEDDTSTDDSATCDSGDFPMVQEIGLDVEDLFCEPGAQSKMLLVELSSPLDSGVDEDFKKLKVQDFEAAPISSRLTPSEDTKSQNSIRGLDDAILQTNSEAANCRLAVKPFETRPRDDGMWNFPEIPDSQNVEPCAAPRVENPKAEYDCEDPSDYLSCLIDSFGAAPSMLDERGAPDLGVARQSPQERGPCSISVCDTLLEDSSIDSSIRAMKPLQIQNMSEKLKIIKNDRIGQSPRSKQRSCDPGLKTASNSVVTFVDLTGADGSSPSDSMAHDTEENSGIRNQERRLPGGTGASLSASVLECEPDSPCTAAKIDNSDHSTLSDEKTTFSTAPPPSFFKFDSRSVSDLSLMNETHACTEVISQKQSSEANPMNCALRQNSTRRGETCFDLEAIHNQQRGSASIAAASFPRAVTAPPSSAATPPLEHPKIDEVFIEKSYSGSLDVKMMRRQPLVIVAANVMEQDGPVLPRRRSSYQRILALENEQLQVVERERYLPVDLILSPSTCLIVYTAVTMKLNWEKVSDLVYKECSAFIADIIVNCQMKAMSFSFEKCYMVFEGEPAFTSFILQATPKLAVAAAGFGMQVQCFVSGSPQCTEDIALMCIERMRKTAKRPYPSLMPECENDDELFLEQFPSLNPLAAHAILCLNQGLNVPLSKFMLWSHDAMADALQGFEVPAESLRLFKLQSEHKKPKDGQGPRNTMRPEESYPDNSPFLPPASSGIDDFETAFNDGLGRGGYTNPFCPSLDRIFEIHPLGDGPTSDEHMAFSPPFGPAFQLDPRFDEEFKSERCFNFWDDPYQLSKQEQLPVGPWPEERPTQRPTTQCNSNQSQKPGYVQSCLDDWIEKMKRDTSDPNCTKRESECEFLDLAKASIPSQVRQKVLFPTLNFELHGREKVQSATINVTPAKRAASALDLYRHQKGISRPLQKKLKPVSRPPHLRSAVVDVSSVQAAQAHLSKRFCFKPVSNPSRFSRSS